MRINFVRSCARKLQQKSQCAGQPADWRKGAQHAKGETPVIHPKDVVAACTTVTMVKFTVVNGVEVCVSRGIYSSADYTPENTVVPETFRVADVKVV